VGLHAAKASTTKNTAHKHFKHATTERNKSQLPQTDPRDARVSYTKVDAQRDNLEMVVGG